MYNDSNNDIGTILFIHITVVILRNIQDGGWYFSPVRSKLIN